MSLCLKLVGLASLDKRILNYFLLSSNHSDYMKSSSAATIESECTMYRYLYSRIMIPGTSYHLADGDAADLGH